MKRSYLLMGLWAEEGKTTASALERQFRARKNEIPDAGEIYCLREKRGENWVNFVGVEVDRYDELPRGMEVWYLSGNFVEEEIPGATRLTNLSSGEVLYEYKEQGNNRHFLKDLWKDAVCGEAIFDRRSVRKFMEAEVEEGKIKDLLRAAMQAPSAKNQQPWEFIVVRNKGMMKSLASKLPTMRMLGHAPLCIAILGNTEHLLSPSRWPQDLSASTQNLLLEAHNQGLGAVWLGVYPEEKRMSLVREILDVEEPLVPFALVAVGYAQEYPDPVDRYDERKVHYR